MTHFKLFSKTSAIAVMFALHPLQILNAFDVYCGTLWPVLCSNSSYSRTIIECSDSKSVNYNFVATTCYTEGPKSDGIQRIVPNGRQICVRTRESIINYCDSNNRLQGPIYNSWEITNSCPKFKVDGICPIAYQSTSPQPSKTVAFVAASISN